MNIQPDGRPNRLGWQLENKIQIHTQPKVLCLSLRPTHKLAKLAKLAKLTKRAKLAKLALWPACSLAVLPLGQRLGLLFSPKGSRRAWCQLLWMCLAANRRHSQAQLGALASLS